jgi:hypothetical protein
VGLRAGNHSGEEQINGLERVLNKEAEFANITNDSNWEMEQRRKMPRIFGIYKAYCCLEGNM